MITEIKEEMRKLGIIIEDLIEEQNSQIIELLKKTNQKSTLTVGRVISKK